MIFDGLDIKGSLLSAPAPSLTTPAITLSSGASGSWTVDTETVTIGGSTDTSGSPSPISYQYSLDGGAMTSYTGPVSVSAVGSHTITAQATDTFGVTSPTASASFSVDHTVSVTHPVSAAYSIDPNTDTFTAPNILLTNNSAHNGVKVALTSFQSTGSLHDVLPNKYSDWSKLTAAQTQSDMALGVFVIETGTSSAGWSEIDQTTPLYAATVQSPVTLGVLNPGGTGNLSLTAKYGRAWAKATTSQHQMIFQFTLD